MLMKYENVSLLLILLTAQYATPNETERKP